MSLGVAQVQASLAHARDAQVARVVAMVDSLPDRGAADALIAPLRPRLAAIRPARPAGFARVLFSPLDTVITPMAEWRRSGAGVPRPALAPLAAAVRAALPEFSDASDGSFAGSAAALWYAAAPVLEAMGVPAGWEAAKLQAPDHASIKAAAAAVLHEAAGIEALANGRLMADDAAIWPILSRSKARGSVALDTVVSVLLARLPVPAQVAALAMEASGSDGVTGRAIDRLACAVSTRDPAGSDIRDAAKEAARVAVLLTALETGASPARRARLDAIRRDADGQCRRSFGQAVTQTLALVPPPGCLGLDDESMAALESSARDLRRLAAAARRLGSGGHYDSALEQTATALDESCGGLGLADKVRLLEILAGPDRALEMLASHAGGQDG